MVIKNKKLLPILASGLAFSIWGLNVPLIRTSLETVPLFPLLAVKYAFGGIVFSLFAYKEWQPIKKALRPRILVATILGYVLTSIFLYKGIMLTGGLNASLIYLLAPLILYFSSIRFLKERYDSKLLFAVIAGLIGSFLILATPLLFGQTGAKGSLLGNMLILFAVIADVSGTVLIKPALKKVSVMQLTAYRFNIAALVFIPLAIYELPATSHIIWTTQTYVAVAYNLLFATLAAFYLYHWSFKRMSGEQISPMHYLDPLVGSIGSMILLSERPAPTVLIGISLIAAGLYFGESHKVKIKHHIGHHR